MNTLGDLVVAVEHVGKKYCRSLRCSMVYLAMDLGTEILGRRPARSQLKAHEFWVLHDVSFVLRRAECLSIIGANGAGKSTLLKLLCGVQRPDAGRIRIRGRVGALIELGAGFHPLLSGRENIRLLASLYGLTKQEIEQRFDWIVEFAGLERALDMPVRNYSSGMVAKLAFSVASSVQPDVLLVDEVLSVGDLAFRARCLRRITEMMAQGTAIVFVSHQMSLVDKISDRVLFLQAGRPPELGAPAAMIDAYRDAMSTQDAGHDRVDHESLRVDEVRITPIAQDVIVPGGSIMLEARYFAESAQLCCLSFAFHAGRGEQIAACRTDKDGFGPVTLAAGKGRFSMRVDGLPLAPGYYSVSVRIYGANGVDVLVDHQAEYPFIVGGGADVEGVVTMPHRWTINDAHR